jgi:serine/threonine protein kinase
MAMVSDRWQEITPSQFPWEREALAFIRDRLPDHDPYRAWSNFEFIADDGTINEVDLLVLTPAGFFMIEIKSRPGKLTGDNNTWRWVGDDGKVHTRDNPLLLISRKARKFVSLLRRQKAMSKVASPYLDELVFCSATNIECHLSGPARSRVCLRDDPEQQKKGILAAILDRDCPGLKPDSRRMDTPMAKAVGRAIEQIGIRPSQRSRKVGDFVLEALLFQCPKDTYQEWSASHVSAKNAQKRRVRIYNVARNESEASKSLINQAAEREFRLLEQLDHDGILRAEQFTQHELGPALIFRHDPGAVRLDHFLSQQGDRLPVDIRLSLVRQISEALKFAHGKGIVHRTLSPQSILVYDPETPKPRIKIFNWQLGRQFISTSTSTSFRMTHSLHPEQLVEDASLLYMAPETITAPESAEPYVDVFSLGAITYHIFSGSPPATSSKELTQKLAEQRGLDISAVSDGAGDELRDLIKSSTDPDVNNRWDSVADFLEGLERVEEELTRPDENFVANPLDARTGDLLEGGFKVKKRLGSGGTATAFLVSFKEREVVLKLANKPEYAERMEAEHKALRKLRHPLIVEAYEFVEISGLKGFTVQYAGDETLAQRLRQDGRLQLEFLQRFGEDLLDILKHLEEHGIYHRDIKPDNIGVGYPTSKSKLRLLLFDFSLSSTSLDNTRAGTIRYRDPFLQMPVPRNYDLYAERFSAAMTLYEMATGTVPQWGDGKSDPAMLDCEATIQTEMFDPSLRSSMSEFFRRAFQRDYKKRFDNADEMLRAWRSFFEHVEKAPTTTVHETEFNQAEAIANSDRQTQLITLGLSTRALNAMDHLNVMTVEALLQLPIIRFRQLRGVGHKTRKEITELAHNLHRKFPEIHIDDRAGEKPVKSSGVEEAVTAPGEGYSVDALFRDACSTGGKPQSSSRAALMAYLGVPEEQPLGSWPNQSDLGRQFQVTRARIGQIVSGAREQWRRMPSLTLLRDDIQSIISGYGGVMSLPDVAAALLAARGSVSDEPQRSRRAMAVVRAAVEAERGNQDVRFVDCRVNDRVLITQEPELARYAEKLGPIADDLASQDPLVAPDRAIQRLRSVSLPDGQTGLRTDSDLLKLAVYLSSEAAVSSRMELYPRNMTAIRALRLAAGALSGNIELTVSAMRERVKGRYPESEDLPDRPELDTLLAEIGLELDWIPSAANDQGAYRFRRTDQYTLSSGTYGTGGTHVETGTPQVESEAEVRLFERKLASADKDGAFLVLSVAPHDLVRAEQVLRKRFKLEARNLDRLVIPELKEKADEKRIKWEVVLRADQSDHSSRGWANLTSLFRLGMADVEAHLSKCDKTVLLTYPGLLARYDQMSVLDRLRDRIGVQGSELHGLWVLVPEESAGPLPTLAGKPIPVIGSGQHARIPSVWLKGALDK